MIYSVYNGLMTNAECIIVVQIGRPLRLFRYIENFTTKKGKYSDKKKSISFHILLKT